MLAHALAKALGRPFSLSRTPIAEKSTRQRKYEAIHNNLPAEAEGRTDRSESYNHNKGKICCCRSYALSFVGSVRCIDYGTNEDPEERQKVVCSRTGHFAKANEIYSLIVYSPWSGHTFVSSALRLKGDGWIMERLRPGGGFQIFFKKYIAELHKFFGLIFILAESNFMSGNAGDVATARWKREHTMTRTWCIGHELDMHGRKECSCFNPNDSNMLENQACIL